MVRGIGLQGNVSLFHTNYSTPHDVRQLQRSTFIHLNPLRENKSARASTNYCLPVGGINAEDSSPESLCVRHLSNVPLSFTMQETRLRILSRSIQPCALGGHLPRRFTFTSVLRLLLNSCTPILRQNEVFHTLPDHQRPSEGVYVPLMAKKHL
jgi:hypothetical protein